MDAAPGSRSTSVGGSTVMSSSSHRRAGRTSVDRRSGPADDALASTARMVEDVDVEVAGVQPHGAPQDIVADKGVNPALRRPRP